MNFRDQEFYDQLLYNKKGTEFGCNERLKKCTTILWKVFVMVGMTLLVGGVCFVLYGYLSRIKSTAVPPTPDSEINFIERRFVSQNRELDIFKLVGLICFCIGGITMAVALMIPSFLYRYMEDEDDDLTFEDQHPFANDYLVSGNSPLPAAHIPMDGHLSEVQYPSNTRTE